MGRILSSLADGEHMLSLSTKLPDSPHYRNGLKRTSSLRDSWKRKLLRMPPQMRQKAREASLARSPKRQSKGLKAEQAKYRRLAAAFLARPENRLCWICVIRREHGENILINLATEVHHWALRAGRLLCYVPYFRASCFRCREFPHKNTKLAREMGVLAPVNICGVFPE